MSAATGPVVQAWRTDTFRRLTKRLADRDLVLDVDERAQHWLADRGYDPEFGARPVKRLLQRTILEPLSRAILAGQFGRGDIVRVIVSDDGESLEIANDPAMRSASRAPIGAPRIG